MAPWVKCLMYKCENQSLDAPNHVKPSMVACVCDLSALKGKMGGRDRIPRSSWAS